MQEAKSDITHLIIDYMIELSRGACSIKEEQILNEANPGTQRILLGFLHLHEDLQFKSHQIKSFSDHALSRSSEILDILLATAQLDYSKKVKLTDNNDVFDGIATGLNMLSEELEHRINEKEEMLAEIQESNKELNTFMYKASHDLRGPLSSMFGLVNIAREETKDPLVHKYLDLIKTSVKKLDNILEELMQITIIKQGKTQREPVKINELIKDVLQTFQSHEHFDEINITVSDKPTSRITCDSRLLKTVFRNLIENAIKYRNIGAENPFVHITVRKKSENILIEIADNGMGIPEKYHGQIFDMFFRANESSKGSGLGLYIVKNAVEKLGGTIQVKSKIKAGTTFSVSLPN